MEGDPKWFEERGTELICPPTDYLPPACLEPCLEPHLDIGSLIAQIGQHAELNMA